MTTDPAVDRSAAQPSVGDEAAAAPNRPVTTSPQVVHRLEQPYVGITETFTMTTFGVLVDRMPEIFSWLAERGIAPAGAPFFRYLVIDMDADLVVEGGVPVAEPVTPEITPTVGMSGGDPATGEPADDPAGDPDPGQLHAGVLPAGRYATVVHVGHPDELLQVTADLLHWADQQGLRFDSHPSEAGEVWGSRLELYETDPQVEPDMTRWQTRLAFRLAD